MLTTRNTHDNKWMFSWIETAPPWWRTTTTQCGNIETRSSSSPTFIWFFILNLLFFFFTQIHGTQTVHHVGPGHPHRHFPDPAVGCDGDRGKDSHVWGHQVGGGQLPGGGEAQGPGGGVPEGAAAVGWEEVRWPGGERRTCEDREVCWLCQGWCGAVQWHRRRKARRTAGW